MNGPGIDWDAWERWNTTPPPGYVDDGWTATHDEEDEQ